MAISRSAVRCRRGRQAPERKRAEGSRQSPHRSSGTGEKPSEEARGAVRRARSGGRIPVPAKAGEPVRQRCGERLPGRLCLRLPRDRGRGRKRSDRKRRRRGRPGAGGERGCGSPPCGTLRFARIFRWTPACPREGRRLPWRRSSPRTSGPGAGSSAWRARSGGCAGVDGPSRR